MIKNKLKNLQIHDKFHRSNFQCKYIFYIVFIILTKTSEKHSFTPLKLSINQK